MKFLDRVELNPKISLEKGKVYPFIEMANIGFYTRQPSQVDFKNYTSGVKFEDGDTVIARITPCLQNGKGFYCYDIGKGFGSTEFLVFRSKNNSLNDKYLYYFMQTSFIRESMIKSMVGSTGRQRVNNEVFEHIDVNFPDIETQKRIADVLSKYDDLIENNQKQIKLLEEAAQHLYKEWFVDLHFPGYENVKIVDGVPQGWKKELVEDVIGKLSRTKQIKTAEYLNKGDIPVIDQSRNFIAGYTNDNDAIVDIGRPVIVFGDHTRILKYIQFPFAKGADGTQLIVSKSDNMPQSLLYLSLIAVDLSNYHYARHFKYLKAELILVPTKDIAIKFDKLVSPIFLQIQKLRDKCNKLAEARDRLLPKLLSREIEV